MPPRGNRTPASDPQATPTSPSAPTYASIVRLASATRQHAVPRRHASVGPQHASATLQIGSEEVDRQEELDDLDPSFIPVPWRALSRAGLPLFDEHPAEQPPSTTHRDGTEDEDRNVADEVFAPFPPLVSLDELLEEGSGSNEGGDDGGGILTRLRPSNHESLDDGEESTNRPNRLRNLLSTQLPPPTADSIIFRPHRAGNLGSASRTLRRRRPLIRGPSSSDTEEEGEDIEVDLDEDEPFEWTRIVPTEMRRSSGMYEQRNRTEEDLTVLGGSGGAMSLRRGMFNGRRRRVIDRLRELDTVRPIPGYFPAPTPIRPVVRTGLPPTNSGVQMNDPITVSSDDTASRPNKRGGEDQPGERSSKRRKMSSTHETDTKPALTIPDRPSYLSYTTCPPSVPLPSSFGRPHQGSSVTLGTHETLSYPPRPCITFTFTNLPGGPRDDEHASSLRADVPAPAECGVYYYEAEVLDAGKCGYMAVGWMKKENRLNKLVGWDKGSYGWHGDDGRSFAGISTGEPFAEGWTTGDVVGCGINFVTKRGFFTKNGKLMGHVFNDLGRNLYPAIGLRSPKESIVVNFTGPFVFDIDKYVKQVRDTAWESLLLNPTIHSFGPSKNTKSLLQTTIESVKASKVIHADVEIDEEPAVPYSTTTDVTPGPAYQSVKERVPAAFVLDYLQHEGYDKTLSTLKKDMARLGRIKAPLQNHQSRHDSDEHAKMADFPSKEACLQWLKERIANSDKFPLPWSLIDETVPDRDKRVLKIHHFIYTLRQAMEQGSDEFNAIRYIQSVSAESKFWSNEDKATLADAIALLGSSPAEWGPNGISGQSQRDEDAARCIASAREYLGMKPLSYLSLAFGQLSTALKFMASDEPIATFIDPNRLLGDPAAYHEIKGCEADKVTGRSDVKVEEPEVKTPPECGQGTT